MRLKLNRDLESPLSVIFIVIILNKSKLTFVRQHLAILIV